MENNELKKKVEQILDCSNCHFAACEQCEISYTDKQLIKKYIVEKDNVIKDIIKRLDNDIVKITNTLKDGEHNDDYSRNRLKAYRTKTKELKEYINKKYFQDFFKDTDDELSKFV